MPIYAVSYRTAEEVHKIALRIRNEVRDMETAVRVTREQLKATLDDGSFQISASASEAEGLAKELEARRRLLCPECNGEVVREKYRYELMEYDPIGRNTQNHSYCDTCHRTGLSPTGLKANGFIVGEF